METIRSDKWHDPIVLFFCVLILIPVMMYGMISGLLRDWWKGPPEKCRQMGEMSKEELNDLRIKYERMIHK